MPKNRWVDFKAVKQRVSILQILDHYQLTDRFQHKGDSLCGVCPLHDGQNPMQFRVRISKNCWNCFGKCKRGGNILDFVSLMENVSIREAAIRISDWFNLTFDKASNAREPNAPARPGGREAKRGKSAHSQATSEPPAEQQRTDPNKPFGFSSAI